MNLVLKLFKFSLQQRPMHAFSTTVCDKDISIIEVIYWDHSRVLATKADESVKSQLLNRCTMTNAAVTFSLQKIWWKGTSLGL